MCTMNRDDGGPEPTVRFTRRGTVPRGFFFIFKTTFVFATYIHEILALFSRDKFIIIN